MSEKLLNEKRLSRMEISEVRIPIATNIELRGTLSIPKKAAGLVLFAHGSGSSRQSPRNQFVASYLRKDGLATLLMDLLTEEEEQDRENVFDIELLAARIDWVAKWVTHQPLLSDLPVGLFGASTGAAAALIAAAKNPHLYLSVVCRGGRVDLAGEYVSAVQSPTILIVGGEDDAVLDINENALEKMHCIKNLTVITGAGHLFEEPDALEQVAKLSRNWFMKYLVGQQAPLLRKRESYG